MSVYKPNKSSTKVRIVGSVATKLCVEEFDLCLSPRLRCALLISFESLVFPSCLRVAQCESVVRDREVKPWCAHVVLGLCAKAAITRCYSVSS